MQELSMRRQSSMGAGESAVYHLEWPLPPSPAPATDAEDVIEPAPAGWEQPLVKPETPSEGPAADTTDTGQADE
jgi:hypothetical protein